MKSCYRVLLGRLFRDELGRPGRDDIRQFVLSRIQDISTPPR